MSFDTKLSEMLGWDYLEFPEDEVRAFLLDFDVVTLNDFKEEILNREERGEPLESSLSDIFDWEEENMGDTLSRYGIKSAQDLFDFIGGN